MFDWRGNEYNLGDFVLYPSKSHPNDPIEMTEAKVVDINERGWVCVLPVRKSRSFVMDADRRRRWIRNPVNVTRL